MSHAFYVLLSYGLTGAIICLVALVIWLDGRARRNELAVLEASGIRRRSAQKSQGGAV